MARAKPSNATVDARYERFAREYVLHHVGKRAAVAAGYSEKTAEVQASRLLRNAKVRALIEQYERESADRLEITKDRIERELARIGFADPRRFFDGEGRLLTPEQLGDNEAAALSSVEVFEEFAGKGEDRVLTGYTKKVKFWDKKGALELLGAKFGIGVKKTEVGKPGEFDALSKLSEDELRERAQKKAVRLGLGKVLPLKRAGA
jgi:phage terminase small subunit